MNRLTIADKIMIGVILLAAVGIWGGMFFNRPGGDGTAVILEVNGEVVKTIALPQAETLEYKYMVDEDDYNILQIEGSRVRIIEATCPDQVDVKQGWISKPGETLICLPHKLVVRIAGEKTIDDEIDVKTF